MCDILTLLILFMRKIGLSHKKSIAIFANIYIEGLVNVRNRK